MLYSKKYLGVTLIELMIAIAIIAVLASIALPSYNSSVKKGGRNDAMGALIGFSQAMERFYTMSGSYIGGIDTDGDGIDDQTIGSAAPYTFNIYPNQSPLDGTPKLYTLSIVNATKTTYTLAATPISSTNQAKDGILLLDSAGTQAWDSDNSSLTAVLSNGLIDTSHYASELCWKSVC